MKLCPQELDLDFELLPYHWSVVVLSSNWLTQQDTNKAREWIINHVSEKFAIISKDIIAFENSNEAAFFAIAHDSQIVR